MSQWAARTTRDVHYTGKSSTRQSQAASLYPAHDAAIGLTQPLWKQLCVPHFCDPVRVRKAVNVRLCLRKRAVLLLLGQGRCVHGTKVRQRGSLTSATRVRPSAWPTAASTRRPATSALCCGGGLGPHTSRRSAAPAPSFLVKKASSAAAALACRHRQQPSVSASVGTVSRSYCNYGPTQRGCKYKRSSCTKCQSSS